MVKKITFKKHEWINWEKSTWYDKVWTSYSDIYMYLTIDEIAIKNDCEIKKCVVGDDVDCYIKISYKKEEDFFNFFYGTFK